MTGAKKVLTWLLVEVVLLGAAFGGGFYYQLLKRRAVDKQLEELKKKTEQNDILQGRRLMAARARLQILEACLGVEHENYGMAFDRVIRAQGMARGMGLAVEAEVDEINNLLVQQKPEVFGKLLSLADKIEPTPPLSLPAPAKKPAPAKPGAPAAAGAPEAAAPGGAAPAAAPAPSGDRDFQEGREALRLAKELLLSGSEWSEIVKKLARAQVLLDESGFAELDDELGAAIKAAKSHEEARVRAALDSALTRLRTPTR